MSFSIITAKTPFLSSLLISLYYKSVNGVFYTTAMCMTSFTPPLAKNIISLRYAGSRAIVVNAHAWL